jgi:VanZ family protein
VKNIKTLLALKSIWLTLAISWTSIILFLCLIESSELPSLNVKIEGIDKGIHFIFHFLFTFLWSVYIYSINKNINRNKIVKVILGSIVFGVLIEIIQEFFTTTRQADSKDILANTLGALVAGILFYYYTNRIKKLKS